MLTLFSVEIAKWFPKRQFIHFQEITGSTGPKKASSDKKQEPNQEDGTEGAHVNESNGVADEEDYGADEDEDDVADEGEDDGADEGESDGASAVEDEGQGGHGVVHGSEQRPDQVETLKSARKIIDALDGSPATDFNIGQSILLHDQTSKAYAVKGRSDVLTVVASKDMGRKLQLKSMFLRSHLNQTYG